LALAYLLNTGTQAYLCTLADVHLCRNAHVVDTLAHVIADSLLHIIIAGGDVYAYVNHILMNRIHVTFETALRDEQLFDGMCVLCARHAHAAHPAHEHRVMFTAAPIESDSALLSRTSTVRELFNYLYMHMNVRFPHNVLITDECTREYARVNQVCVRSVRADSS
jgi:hypothetical protein